MNDCPAEPGGKLNGTAGRRIHGRIIVVGAAEQVIIDSLSKSCFSIDFQICIWKIWS